MSKLLTKAVKGVTPRGKEQMLLGATASSSGRL